MKRIPVTRRRAYVWLYRSTVEEKQQQSKHLNKENKPGEKESGDKKQTPEQVIRSLQGVFCNGRCRSWVLSRGKEKNA